MMEPKWKYRLRLSYLYRDHLYWLIFTLIASWGCCHVVLLTFTFRGVFEFAYLLFNVFSHFDTFFCIMSISFSTFPNSKLFAMEWIYRINTTCSLHRWSKNWKFQYCTSGRPLGAQNTCCFLSLPIYQLSRKFQPLYFFNYI